MEHAPAFDTLRFARTLVDAGVERRHPEAHAKIASAAIGAAAMKTGSAEGLRAVNDRTDGVENRLGRFERRLDGLYRALRVQGGRHCRHRGRARETVPVALAALMHIMRTFREAIADTDAVAWAALRCVTLPLGEARPRSDNDANANRLWRNARIAAMLAS